MDYKANEQKWQKKWQDDHAHDFDPERMDQKYYVLEMFSYPSASNLHLGHWYNYGVSDTFARFKKMQGFEVFQPMGFDSFGLPAENFAIKTGIHPQDSTLSNIKTMEQQLRNIGAMFTTGTNLYTSDPEYYKWTQWIFLQLYKNGLAYQKESPVNWCNSCNTVIANEQVIDGRCERCKQDIVRKNMVQWSLKITNYAQELLDTLDTLDWPEKTKAMQRNWIGRSEGGEIEFDTFISERIRVFTTRADTLMGVTYIVLAPEHPLVPRLVTDEYRAAVEAYMLSAAKISEIDRLSTAKEKTGQFTGAYCMHPLTGVKLPVFIADYCLATYGTGAVMGVPAHDCRDYDFAAKYGLPVVRVIRSKDGSKDDLPYVDHGILTGSGIFDGMQTEKAKTAILSALEENRHGRKKVQYRLRDWSVSRQRYWGAPIPIIHCKQCGAVPVPEKDLPVQLPYQINFTPDGKSPLASCETFMQVTCPVCGKPARRDPDTLDTFVCSSWYFLRYPDNGNNEKAFDSGQINRMLPVDKYIGGAEHACMHLLYARFMTKALRDMGLVDFGEPFRSLVHQGTILGTNGEKMSKSLGNVVNPDVYTEAYGSDILRMYLMFGFSYIEGGPWNDGGIKAVAKFLDRVERIVTKGLEQKDRISTDDTGKDDVLFALHHCIYHVRQDTEIFSFNTAIARIMELVNALYKYDALPQADCRFLHDVSVILIKIIAPFAPHFAEELHARAGFATSVFLEAYPEADADKLKKNTVEIAIQINSKIREKITVPSGTTQAELEKIVLGNEHILTLLEGKAVKKIIIIPDRLANLII